MIKWLTPAVISVLLVGNVVQSVPNGTRYYWVKGLQCWSRFFSMDTSAGSGDYEKLVDLHRKYPGMICEHPLDIEVQTVTGVSVTATGDTITLMDKDRGFICKNCGQKGHKQCEDYMVSYRCPMKFCLREECWTSWFDEDNPYHYGDYETFSNLRKKKPNQVCEKPLDIEVQTTFGESAASTGDVISVSLEGLICRNRDQGPGNMCQDYKVRYKCPMTFCDPPQCWTRMFSTDRPTGTGDYELVHRLHEKYPDDICENPIDMDVRTLSGDTLASTEDVIAVNDKGKGFICKNSDQRDRRCHDYQIKFRCPLDFCIRAHCWTDWFSVTDPKLDLWMIFINLHKQHPGRICEKPWTLELKDTAQQTSNGTLIQNHQGRVMCDPDECPQEDSASTSMML